MRTPETPVGRPGPGRPARILFLALLGLASTTAAHPAPADRPPLSAIAASSPEGVALAERMMAAFGDREVWASRVVDHITAVIESPDGERYLVEIFTRWDRPQTLFWIRTRTREQLRGFDGTTGWTATRAYGQPAEIKTWTSERVALEQLQYRGQFERLVHRIALGDQTLSFTVGGGAYQGWLEVSEQGTLILRVRLRADGSPDRVWSVGNDDEPARFEPLASFGDHQQPGAGVAGGAARFTTLLAELRPTAGGIRFDQPSRLDRLDPTR